LHLWEKAKEMAKSMCKEEDGVGIEMWMVRRITLWRTETAADKQIKVVHGRSYRYRLREMVYRC